MPRNGSQSLEEAIKAQMNVSMQSERRQSLDRIPGATAKPTFFGIGRFGCFHVAANNVETAKILWSRGLPRLHCDGPDRRTERMRKTQRIGSLVGRGKRWRPSFEHGDRHHAACEQRTRSLRSAHVPPARSRRVPPRTPPDPFLRGPSEKVTELQPSHSAGDR